MVHSLVDDLASCMQKSLSLFRNGRIMSSRRVDLWIYIAHHWIATDAFRLFVGMT